MKSVKLIALVLLAIFLLVVPLAWSQGGTPPASTWESRQLESVVPDAYALYLDLHQHPELSAHETRTAALLAERLRKLGYEVTEHVGGTGVVGIMKNGPGPTVMLRTELDALPVEEQTGLPYASKVRAKDDSGRDVPVMHACGHDLHMSSWWGTAAIMAHSKDNWHGTLMLIAQPAEETNSGARKMIEDGLFTRFPKPDIGIALHDTNSMPNCVTSGNDTERPRSINSWLDSEIKCGVYAAWSTLTGSDKVMTAPPPGRSETRVPPPWAWATASTNASPRP